MSFSFSLSPTKRTILRREADGADASVEMSKFSHASESQEADVVEWNRNLKGNMYKSLSNTSKI